MILFNFALIIIIFQCYTESKLRFSHNYKRVRGFNGKDNSTRFTHLHPDKQEVKINPLFENCRCGFKRKKETFYRKDTVDYSDTVGYDIKITGGKDAHWVLTAAHCFHWKDSITRENRVYESKDIAVVLGEHNLSINQESPIELTFEVDKIIEHPKYVPDPVRKHHDIALLRLQTRANIWVYTPVCLPYKKQEFSGSSWTYGWGLLRDGKGEIVHHTLQEINIPIVDHAECYEAYSELYYEVTHGMICAGGQEKDACKGDSGGPLTVNVHGQHYLAGITSWGEGCAQIGSYGVYTKVSYYLEWIWDTVARNGGAHACYH